MGRNRAKKKEYDRLRYERLKENNPNFLNKVAKKRRDWRAKNPERNRENQKRWKSIHSEQVKNMNRNWCYRTKYKITLEEYNRILAVQNGVCILCGKRTAYKNKGRNLFIDHDHKTNRIRGLLCSRCNTMVGHIELVGLEKIIQYLLK